MKPDARIDIEPQASRSTVTLLDYYAAHAPADPLWDFPLRGIGKRPEAIWVGPPADCALTNEAELRAYDEARKKARIVQWPFVWANAMLDERLNHL
jgi:hypothetical protein